MRSLVSLRLSSEMMRRDETKRDEMKWNMFTTFSISDELFEFQDAI